MTETRDGIEVRALQVFDQTEHELLIASGLAAHDSRHGVEPRQARRSPAAFAGDQLVSVGQAADEQWLQHAVHAD